MLLTLFSWSYMDLRFLLCYILDEALCVFLWSSLNYTGNCFTALHCCYTLLCSAPIFWMKCLLRCCHVTSITIGNWFQLFIIASSQSPLLLLWNGSQRSIWCQLWSGLNFWMWWEMCGFKWGSWSWRSVTLIWIWIGLIWALWIQYPNLCALNKPPNILVLLHCFINMQQLWCFHHPDYWVCYSVSFSSLP